MPASVDPEPDALRLAQPEIEIPSELAESVPAANDPNETLSLAMRRALRYSTRGVLADNFTRARTQTAALPARVVQFAGWFVLGILAFAIELGLLAILHQWLGMHLWQASALAGEAVILGRFLTTDRFVFGYATPTFGRCWRYHVAAAGSFTVSWLVLNSTAHALELPYPVAAFLGSAAAFAWSGVTNFLWVWRAR